MQIWASAKREGVLKRVPLESVSLAISMHSIFGVFDDTELRFKLILLSSELVDIFFDIVSILVLKDFLFVRRRSSHRLADTCA